MGRDLALIYCHAFFQLAGKMSKRSEGEPRAYIGWVLVYEKSRAVRFGGNWNPDRRQNAVGYEERAEEQKHKARV